MNHREYHIIHNCLYLKQAILLNSLLIGSFYLRAEIWECGGKIMCVPVCVCMDVCLFVGFWNHILLYYYVPFLCATPKPMNWAKQSKWSLVPLNTPWAGGSVWPFAAQHLSNTVSVSSLSFNLSLSPRLHCAAPLSASLYHAHCFLCGCFLTRIPLCACASRHTQICVLWHAHSAHIYTRIITAWHASLLSHSVLSWGERLGFS